MSVLIEALWISLVQLGLLLVCGLGAARLLLSPRLRAHELTLAPLFGLALLALMGFYGTNAGLTLRQLLPIVLALGVALLALAAWCHIDGRLAPGSLPLRELIPLLALAAGAWLFAIAPTLRYGALTPIGHNWDVEFYLPLAEYLKQYSYLSLGQAPTNPLRDLVLSERIVSRAMGGTYAQGMADLLAGRDAWATWVPMLALLHALTLPGLYALLREGFGVRAPGALAGCALAGINALLLWTTYNSFGMGLAGTALLPAAIVCGLVALESGRRRVVVGAGFVLGGLSCTYWPILQPYGAAMLGVGAALLVARRQETGSRGDPRGRLGRKDAEASAVPDLVLAMRWRGLVVLRGLAMLALGGVFGLLAHLRAPAAFLGVFEARTPSMGVTEFISPAVMLGSAGYSHLGLEGGPLATTVAWAGALAALVLLAIGAWSGSTRRALAIGMALCLVVYLAALQYVVRFPYGLLRGASYVAPLLLGLVGAGLLGGERRPPADDHRPSTDDRPTTTDQPPALGAAKELFVLRQVPRRVSLLRRVSVALFAVVLGSAGFAAYRTYTVYADRPGTFGIEEAGARAVVAELTTSGPASVSAAAELRGPYMGAWAYALRDRELLGFTTTGYSMLANPRPGAAPAYGLLRRNEDPRAYGLDPARPVWQSDRAALYAAPPGLIAWLNGHTGAGADGQLLAADTTLSRARIGGGDLLEARPDQPIALAVNASGIVAGTQPAGETARRDLRLEIVSFVPQMVELESGDERRSFEVQPGLTVYATGSLTVPVRVTLRGTRSPLFLRSAGLFAERVPISADTPQLLDDTLVFGLNTEVREAAASTRIRVQNNNGEVLRLAVEIYEDMAGYSRAPAHYAWSLFQAPQAGEHLLELDLQQPTMRFNRQPLPVQAGDVRDGRFFAALWVYQGDQVRQIIPFLSFERQGGSVANVAPIGANATFAQPVPAAQPLDAATAEGITLSGYELSAAEAQPGDELRVALHWQAQRKPPQTYMVFVQVLDGADRKVAQWDGAAGGDWYPTPAWEAGQRIRQDVPLRIAPDAFPGSYRVIAGLYDPATGQRLRFTGGNDSVGLGSIEVR